MQNHSEMMQRPQMLHESEHPLLEVFGPTIQFLTSPEEGKGKFCILIGVLPNRGFIPIHSHDDMECFFVLSGQQEVVVEEQGKFRWIVCKAGEFIQVDSGVKHGFLNRSTKPASSLIVTSAKLGRFFQEVGRPIAPGSEAEMPTEDELQRLMDAAKRYGYWMASSDENAAVGIPVYASQG
jgi:quercetin dioxygenase-like cupin family protein